MSEKQIKKPSLSARIGKKAEDRRKRLEKQEHLYSKRIVIFCIAFIVLYTGLNVYLNYRLSVELNPTLTTCVYTFFGSELGLCAFTRFIGALEKKNGIKDNGGGGEMPSEPSADS